MKIVSVYVYPVTTADNHENAIRFFGSYNLFPPGIEHEFVVVSNGGQPTFDMKCVISSVDHQAEVFVHNNEGYDIGAFQAVAKSRPADMMVFFGSSAYLRGPKWLKRMADAFVKHGTTNLYGCTANCGDARVNVSPHIRTTGFWLAPMFMNMHPLRVTRPEHRYPFEHGPQCLTQWMRDHGRQAFMVTWQSESVWPAWDSVYGGFHRDQQEGLIAGDRLTAPPYYPNP